MLDAVTTCKMEISSWVDYVTAPGNSIMDAAGEYGLQSLGYQAVENAWTIYAQNVYVVGSDDASDLAVKSIVDSCDRMGDAYATGHFAPN